MDQRYLACQPSRYSRRGMQRDRLPNQIGALWRHPMPRAELARGIRAIHLKPVVAAVGGNHPQVMQNPCAKPSFFLHHRKTQTPHSTATEDIGAKAMSAEKLRRN